MEHNSYFNIAGFDICLAGKDTDASHIELLPSFKAFMTEGVEHKPFVTMTIDDTLFPTKDCSLIRDFDTGNGKTRVCRLHGGGYQYIIRDIEGRDCCLLKTNSDFSQCACALNGTWAMRNFGLNNALMMAFAYSTSQAETLLIHASCVIHDGQAYPFIAQSGTGKSTHSDLWMRCHPGTELLNDDNPIIRIIGGKPYVYGSPWSGKTPCYRNMRAPLGAMTRIERAGTNSIERLEPVRAFASMLPACSSMKWDSAIYNNACNTITRIIETVPVFTMHCLPDEDAAILCHDTITRQTPSR